ncbi:suppressor of fused protein SUFU [Roseimicrobium gellanilyticum]|uniref:Suppressor of fused protein SUFU n=1 Tax=Roseimicrobium gellanilyticum TaxID=748857 RepID=A0A366HR49_9BACT|nr:suppressor of fused domain protein [Roseimicrobium gellanilyticum]RBP46141.1 suppressor of fused protein SUFU [Roseimicrobium gellanilyticum]
MSTNESWEGWFERIWEHREDVLYPRLFGDVNQGIYPIPFSRLEKANLKDPRWSTCGVFKFAPTKQRESWLYVSSGLSNAWFDDLPNPDGISGFGCEFTFETDVDADWPIQRLHQLMVHELGLQLGRLGEKPPMEYFDRIPLGSAIDWEKSELTHVVLSSPTGYDAEFQQESGSALFLAVTGISALERDYAKKHGSQALIELLRAVNAHPVTHAGRSTIDLPSS